MAMAQHEAASHERPDVERNPRVAEPWIVEAQVGDDRIADVPGQEDRAVHGRARHRVDERAGELEQTDARHPA